MAMILIPIGIFAVFTAIGVMLYYASSGAEKKRFIARATGGGAAVAEESFGGGMTAEPRPMSSVDSAFSGFRFHVYLTGEFRKANLDIRVSEYITLTMFCATIPAAIVHYVLHRPGLTTIFVVAGVVIPIFFVKHRQAARRKAFSGQLLDAVLLISNSIKSGYSFLQAVDLAGKEMPPPIGEEFRRVIHDTNYGIPFDSAVGQLAKRMDNEDLDLILTTVMIQRRIGGNLSEILEKIAHTIRERVRVKGEIRTLTAQGRLSGLILSLLPVGVGFILFLINPEYISILFKEPVGRFLLAYAALSVIFGAMLIQKIVSIEV